jgi:hypothetical protein
MHSIKTWLIIGVLKNYSDVIASPDSVPFPAMAGLRDRDRETCQSPLSITMKEFFGG